MDQEENGGAHPAGQDTATEPQRDLPPGYVPYEAEPANQPLQVDDHGQIPSPEAATAGYKPLESEEIEQAKREYPPDVDPTEDIGGSAEDRGTLRDEYRRG